MSWHLGPPNEHARANGAYRVLITGSRTWDDMFSIADAIDEAIKHAGRTIVVVHGACPRGADAITAGYCEALQYHGKAVVLEPHPADWDHCTIDCPQTPHRLIKKPGDVDHPGARDDYCPGAGPRRNADMVRLGADLCLAFIHKASRGASGTAELAEQAGIRTVRFPPGGVIA